MECPYEASNVAQNLTSQQGTQEIPFKFLETWIDHVRAFEELDTTIIVLTPKCIKSLSLDVTNFLVVRAPKVNDEVGGRGLTFFDMHRYPIDVIQTGIRSNLCAFKLLAPN